MKNKILKISGIALLVLLLLILALPFLFKDKIYGKVQEELNKSLSATIQIESFSLSMFSTFPNFKLGLTNLTIAGKDDFKGDTLIKAGQIDVVVDLMSVIKGDQVEIRKVNLENANINLLVNAAGKANWDITKPTPKPEPGKEEQPSNLKIGLQKYSLINCNISYKDIPGAMETVVKGLNHKGSGDFTADRTQLSTETSIASLDYNYGGISYLKKAKLNYAADFDLDLKNSIYAFEKNELTLNDLILQFEGKISMPKDDIGIDIKWNAPKNEVKNFISLIPGAFTADFKDVQSGGTLALNGYVNGILSDKLMPSFGVNVRIDKGSIRYPALPKSVTGIQLDLSIVNKGSQADQTVVEMRSLHADFGSFPLDAKLMLTRPISDPTINFGLKTRIDLGAIDEFVPLDKATKLSGLLNADVNMAGRLALLDAGKYEEFDAKGTIQLSNFDYAAADLPQTVYIRNASMEITPRLMKLQNLSLKTGKSDITASGEVQNYLAYALRDELLKGKLDIQSNYLDVNPFMSTTDTATVAEGQQDVSGYIRVPKNLDFTTTASVKRLIYDNMDIADLSGTLQVRDGQIDIRNLALKTLGGTIDFGGLYDTRNDKGPKIDLQLDMRNLDIGQCSKTFASLNSLAPAAKFARGSVSLEDFHFASQADEAFNPDLKTVNGGGTLVLGKVTLSGFEPVKKVAESLKIAGMNAWAFDGAKASFTIVNGEVILQPFDTKIGGMASTLGGKSGLDQSINYLMNIEIPRAKFGGAAATVLNTLTAKAGAAGIQTANSETIPVGIKIGGTVLNPKITTDIRDRAENAMDDLKKQAEDRAREELEKRKKELEDRANAEKDRLQKEAEAKLNQEKERLKNEADKAKQEAERKAKEEADKAKKKAEEEAKKQLNKLFKGK